jgi:hypothetical protein
VSDYNIESPEGLNSLFQEAKSARRQFEPDWMLNRAFFAGYQWVSYQAGRIGRPAGLDPHRQYVTDNRMKGIIMARVARKSRNRPMFSATPQGGDDDAINSARLGERILENDWEGLALHPKLHTALMWADLCADGFIKVYWDSFAGQKAQVLMGPGGEPLIGPHGGLARPEDTEALAQMNPGILEHVTVSEVAQGDVRNEVKSPFEIYPSPLATCMEDCEYLFDETVRSLDYVRERYQQDINGKDFNPVADADVAGAITEGFFPNGSNLFHSNGASTGGVKVREYYCRPNHRYPKGCRSTWINQTIVAMDDAPDDPMPYVKFASIEVPGRFWSAPVATDLRHPQVDFNVMRTQVKENARRLGNPALLESRQAAVEYHGRVGEKIQYDSTVIDAKPEYLLPPNIPVYIENELERIVRSMEEIAGLHEVSRAQVPNGVTAASAINLLQESDETRLGPEIQQMEFALGEWGTKILKLRARYNTDERLVKIAGKDGRWDVFAFKGEMLGEDPHVEVQAGSQMPRGKAAKQAAMTEILSLIFQYQYPIDERNLRRFLKDYEIGGLDRLFEGMTEDAKQVNREIRQLINGEQVPINSFDNDEFHIADTTEFMKTDQYAALPPQIQANFEAHVGQHRERLAQIAEAAAAAEAQAQAVQQEQEATLQQETEIVKNETAPTRGNESAKPSGS